MEDDSNATLIANIARCAVEANVNQSLQQLLDNNFIITEPNIAILRQALHLCIRSAIETQENKYFAFAEKLGKLICQMAPLDDSKRAEQWLKITKGDMASILTAEDRNRWSWEKYFDVDIKRRKGRLDREQRNETMKLIFNAKKLSLFHAIHYPKVFFTLLKLGADPFEMKPGPTYISNKSYVKSLTYAIVSSKRLSKEKRLHLLHHLSQKNLLKNDRCGPDNISPLHYCLVNQSRRHALTYMIEAFGIDSLEIEGTNMLLSLNGQYDYILQYLTVEQIKKLLMQPEGSFKALYSMKIPKTFCHMQNFLIALKELLTEYPMKEAHTLVNNGIITAQFLVQFGSPNFNYLLTEARKKYSKLSEVIPELRLAKEFKGNTEFPFERLPVELSEIIYSYLPARDQTNLFSVNKYTNTLQNRFGEFFWKSRLQTGFPIVYYSCLQGDTSREMSWRDKTMSVTRSIENLRKGRFTTKILRSKQHFNSVIYSLCMDEHWLCCNSGANLLFWNCNNDTDLKFETKQIPISPYGLVFMNSTPYEIPSYITYDDKAIYYFNNNETKIIQVDDHLFGPRQSSTVSLSPKKFIYKQSIYDIELEKIVAKFPVEVFVSQKIIGSENIIALTQKAIVIYDKNLREVAQSPFPDNHANPDRYGCVLTPLDDHLVLYIAKPGLSRASLFDIRTMRPLFKDEITPWFMRQTNSAYRVISVEKGTGTVWNWKTNTWETTFILPDGAEGLQLYNSRYAVLSSIIEPKYSNVMLLDFDS